MSTGPTRTASARRTATAPPPSCRRSRPTAPASCTVRPAAWAKSPVGRRPTSARSTDLNLNLCELRNIDIEIAAKEGVGFADVFWPMLTAGVRGAEELRHRLRHRRQGRRASRLGRHSVMAYAFLRAFGLDGDIGTFTVDLGQGRARPPEGMRSSLSRTASCGITSRRYPFCASGASRPRTTPSARV